MTGLSGAADDATLRFSWLWQNPQFSDFTLELHLHPPYHQDDLGAEGPPSPGLHAPSPIRRACTPATAASSSAAASPSARDGRAAAAAVGPRHGARAHEDVEADRGGRRPAGASGESDTSRSSVRFTSLQSRQDGAAGATTASVSAVAVASTTSGGSDGGRGPASSSYNGTTARVSGGHAAGVSYAIIGRNGAAAGGSAAGGHAAAPSAFTSVAQAASGAAVTAANVAAPAGSSSAGVRGTPGSAIVAAALQIAVQGPSRAVSAADTAPRRDQRLPPRSARTSNHGDAASVRDPVHAAGLQAAAGGRRTTTNLASSPPERDAMAATTAASSALLQLSPLSGPARETGGLQNLARAASAPRLRAYGHSAPPYATDTQMPYNDGDGAASAGGASLAVDWSAPELWQTAEGWALDGSGEPATAAAAAASTNALATTSGVLDSPSRHDSWDTSAEDSAAGANGGGTNIFWNDDVSCSTRTVRAAASAVTSPVAAAPPLPRPPPLRVFPVHAAVLAATSEYFQTLLQNWSGGLAGSAGERGVLTMFVELEEVEAAETMLRFMYTGRLPPGLSPRQLLSLLLLADQYGVGRLIAAVNAAFAGLPLPGLSLEQLLALYELPEVLLAGGALAGALSKLVDKLVSELGDLELVMDCPSRRIQLVGLPFEAVRLLLQSAETRVWNENTTLAALVEWGAGPMGQSATAEQRRQLAALLRLQHCTHSYLSYIIPQVPWLVTALDPARLLLSLSWARADASTRDVYTAERYFETTTTPAAQQLQADQQQQQQQQQQQHNQRGGHPHGHVQGQGPAGSEVGPALAAAHDTGGSVASSGPSAGASGSGGGVAEGSPAAAVAAATATAAAMPPLPAFVSRPRPLSQRVTFDWSIDFATLQQLYADSKATRSLQVVTSEPAFFGGFHWWLRYDLDASQPPEYREHMGLACNVKLAGRKYSLPCVKVKATVCARQDAGVLGEGTYSLRKSFSYHVMNACPVGLWGFFGLTPDRDEAAWRRFVQDGRVWLRCSIEECQ